LRRPSDQAALEATHPAVRPGYVELLLDDEGDRLTEQQREFLATVPPGSVLAPVSVCRS